jgi:DNA excision repair protein ERCC-4
MRGGCAVNAETNTAAPTTNALNLPALKSLGELANTRSTIIVDSREIQPLIFTRLESRRGTLQTGDYSIAGLEQLFSIERKSIADLVSCCVGESRSRLERELHRLRGYRFKRLLVVGSRDDIYLGRYRSSISPKAVVATLNAFECRYDVPVVFVPNAIQAAHQIETWAYYFVREYIVVANNLLRATACQRIDQAEKTEKEQ